MPYQMHSLKTQFLILALHPPKETSVDPGTAFHSHEKIQAKYRLDQIVTAPLARKNQRSLAQLLRGNTGDFQDQDRTKADQFRGAKAPTRRSAR
jgi:hypothetical protein